MTSKTEKVQDLAVRRKYHTLDGIRGAAALMVLMRHAGFYFGDLGLYLSRGESYLAVDLFFVLSGFVIAEAYDGRLVEGLSSFEFMKIRLIRLYPLYLLGLLIGTVVTLGSFLMGNNINHKTGVQILKDFMFCFFMLPTPFSAALYPFNGPSWSLFFELIANGLYSFFRYFLTTLAMIFLIIVAAIGLGFSAFHFGHLDEGNLWPGFIVGILRVVYSFGAGLLIHRLHLKLPTFRVPSWTLLGFVLILLSLKPPAEILPWYDLIVVILLFPAVVQVASTSEPTFPKIIGIYSFLGTTSYAIYVLHKQVALFVAALFARISRFNVGQFAPFSGVVFLLGLVYVCWLLDRFYDLPVRRWATTMFLKRKKP